MRLSDAYEEKDYIIKGFEGDEHLDGRIAAMGLRAGVALKVIKNKKKLPVLIYARDTLIAIGRGESEKILIGGLSDNEKDKG